MTSRREFLGAAALAATRVSDVKGEKITVTHNGSTLLEYRYTGAKPKAYVHPLCLPNGRALTLDAPKDHVHHRGLMVAWSAVNGIDFWGEVNPARHGSIVHRRFERVRNNEIIDLLDWTAESKLLLTERRTLRIPPPGGDTLWLDWTTELKAAAEPVKLAAAEHVYNGLGIRFTPDMDGGSVLNARGAAAIEKANGDPAAWCCYYGAGAGVAFFDHPSNPGHPNPFFVMNKPFGYLSAAPTFRRFYELAPAQSIVFRWGVLAFAGEPRAAVLDDRFQTWSRGVR